MRKISKLLLLVITVFAFQSCLKDKATHTYKITRPVYKDKAEVYANIKSNAPQQIKSPGKIFLYGNYIFLNEIDKGVHVIDNTNPSSPVEKAFIDIPGNLDIAVKGSTLYADLYSDLVVVDISNPLSAHFEKYIPFVFPVRNYGNGFIGDSTRIIVDWITKDTTVDYPINNTWKRGDIMLYSAVQNAVPGASSNPLTGIAGSMARFSVVNNYLYCVNNSQLLSFNISTPLNPTLGNVSNMNWGIETIYPLQNKLFIGSNAGMFVYDISNPADPVREGQFIHARACDPVIADGDYAYITLHDGTQCSGTSNQLDVVNISNLSSPSLLRTYPMTHPHGLAKAGTLLFVCDGRDGLKMYDASAPGNISLLKQITSIETYDAIAWNNNLIVVARDGLYQYDYSDPSNLIQRSRLLVVQPKPW